jgi:hypothetical protein
MRLAPIRSDLSMHWDRGGSEIANAPGLLRCKFSSVGLQASVNFQCAGLPDRSEIAVNPAEMVGFAVAAQ